jgi:phytoene synthase
MPRSTSFYFSFLVLPRAKREALTAFFDFCRAVDDAVDLEADRDRARETVDRWRDEVDRMFSGREATTPAARRLSPFIDRFRLPRDQFDALIDGVAMDLDTPRYQTFGELEHYCHGVASAVGLICAEIFGYRNPDARTYARELGVALQLTNILRDVAVDYRIGRVYVPGDDLARFGCTEADIAEAAAGGGRAMSPRLRSVLEHQAARARVFFTRATRALPPEDAASFLPAEIMRAIYWDLLRRISAADFDVFTRVVRVPRPAQAGLAAAQWWRDRRRTGRRS